jgi:hypothetical protein
MAYTTINKHTDYFNTKLYTGTGSSLGVTGVGFQPDFTWIKCRAAGSATDHILTDAVRGVTKSLNSNDNSADDTISNALTAFGTDGFTVGANGATGASGDTYVSWNWKAGTTGSGTTGGSGTGKAYSYSVNTTAGFSIVKYAGNGSAGHTIPHHLGAVPKMIIVKDLTDNEPWRVYHVGQGSASKYLELNSNAAETTDNAIWDGATPTSSGFLIGSANPVNNATHDYIAYCFAEKTGYSKFGSYTGNNNADGAFVYTGFKPEFVIVKPYNYQDNWHMIDDKRNPFNPMDTHLFPNLNNLDSTASSYNFDMLSNGFKPRSNNSAFNGSYNYIYMAFGQSLVGSNNVPCTAR